MNGRNRRQPPAVIERALIGRLPAYDLRMTNRYSNIYSCLGGEGAPAATDLVDPQYRSGGRIGAVDSVEAHRAAGQ